MRLLLTYHRIVEGTAAGEFFDLAPAELERHVRLACRQWGRNVSPGELSQPSQRRNGDRQGFLITFDDGTIDHYAAAAPTLERNGLRGVFFVNTLTLGTPGFMTLEQCVELQSRGHAIESHSHGHVQLTSLSDRELHWQLAESRRRLRAAGLGQHDFLAPPGGFFDTRVRNAAAAAGYRLLRTLEWGYNRTADPLRLASITMNRQTAGRVSSLLISPYGEGAKRSFYGMKEAVKGGQPWLYFLVRDARSAVRRLDLTPSWRVRR